MIRFVVMSVCLSVSFGCADASSPLPDAVSTVPRSPAGTFSIESHLAFALPAAARPLLQTLQDATDGPDDPSRFLVDAMVAKLPDGTIAHAAQLVAPYVAAYLEARIGSFAPRLAPGLAKLETSLSRFAQHLDTIETVRISEDGEMARAVTGVDFGDVRVPFAEVGMNEIAATLKVKMFDGHLEIPAHALSIPYGSLLELALERAVVPSLALGTSELGKALASLVDCDKVGALVSEAVGIGGPALYATACVAGTTAVAAKVETAIAAIGDDLQLAVAGSGTGIDRDGDGAMDEIRDGAWYGQPGSAFVVSSAVFSGAH